MEVQFVKGFFQISSFFVVTVSPSESSTQKTATFSRRLPFWQGHKDLNPEPTVLETAALPIELYPYLSKALAYNLVGLQGFEPGTNRL